MYATAAGITDVGQKRDHNEDALHVDEELGLFIVSDGMGGHAAGEVASATTVQTVTRVVGESRQQIEQVRAGAVAPGELTAMLRRAVEEASREVYRLATTTRGRSGMGCTATVLLVVGPHGFLAHVGDSRLYLCRGTMLEQLSVDHSLAQELARAGFITEDEVKGHAHAHVLTRSVGTQPTVKVDTLMFDVLDGDRLLLCSDGLSGYVPDSAWLCGQMQRDDFEAIPAEFVRYANEQGGKDNITAVLVRVDAEAEEAPQSVQLRQTLEGKFVALESVFLFAGLPLALRTRVLEACHTLAAGGGEVLAREGDENGSLYIVVKGACELWRGEQRICRVGPGDCVGVTTLLNQRPARATLQAAEPTTLLRLDQDAFWSVVRERPWLGVGLLERLGRRLSTALDAAMERRSGGDTSPLPGERF
jgi:serine/threonine protein phosphatase PrpC